MGSKVTSFAGHVVKDSVPVVSFEKILSVAHSLEGVVIVKRELVRISAEGDEQLVLSKRQGAVAREGIHRTEDLLGEKVRAVELRKNLFFNECAEHSLKLHQRCRSAFFCRTQTADL